MADDPTRNMIDGMLSQLEKEDMAGLSIDDLRDAMTAPGAAEAVAELMPIEAASVQQGAPAPDFELAWLPGSGPDGETLRLSSHFGERPVALVFGSYT
ncbi:MAG: hypothetical protein JRH01_24150 [Deltaproteobacteria bacterium]|nr:hypothetical protein [Deltaproteobacteria bacterium]